MKHRALCSFGVIPAFFNIWVSAAGASTVPQTTRNHSIPLQQGQNGDVWDSMVPSSELVYHQCYGGFECARLQVPLDYLAEYPDEAHAYIAIIKYASDPVEYPEYSESWGGPILFNPGGPGGSGVAFVLDAGPGLQKMVGSQYSIIGFDSRGVNNTRPTVSCFDTPYDRLLFDVKGGGRTIGSGGDEEVGELFARGKLFGNICTANGTAKDLQHVGTAHVARDMLTINDCIWNLAPKKVRRKGLQYWGFSYGSALGITYATLFPDKIERMILDGVMDVNDWFNGPKDKMLVHAEAVMDSFYKFCFEGGPLRCSFYTGSKPEDIEQRLTHVLESLRTQPLPYSISPYGTSQTELFTYSHLRTTIAVALYSPLQLFEPLADFLVLLESSLELEYLGTDPRIRPPLTCSLDEFASLANSNLLVMESQMAIMCGDSPSMTNQTLADVRKWFGQIDKQSPTMGPFLATRMLACAGWMSEAKEKPPKFEEAKETDKWGGAPIMFIGNTGDPITPLENAYSMAKLFPANASVSMVQEGEGHCSLAVPSECMIGAIQTYLATGKAPPEDKRYCDRVLAPFVGAVSGSSKRSEALETMRNVGQQLHRRTGGGYF